MSFEPTDDFSGYLELVDAKLHQQNSPVIAGLDRLLASGGKRLRARIIILIVHCSGGEITEQVIDLAASIELIHLASLIHDDIIDNSELRRGKPTINAHEGQNTAILAGDWLLGKGFSLAAGVSAESAEFVSNAIMQLCEGEALELQSQFDTSRTEQSLLAAIHGKTSAMFEAACLLGSHSADLKPDQQELLQSFARDFGIAFQYLDDIENFVEPYGNDTSEGNYTLPVILSLNGPKASRLKELLKTDDYAKIQALIASDDSLQKTQAKAESYQQKALAKLEKLENQLLVASLKSLF